MSDHADDAMLSQECECGHRASLHFIWGSCSKCTRCTMFALRTGSDTSPASGRLPWMYRFRERASTLMSVNGEMPLVTVSQTYLDDLEAVAHAAVRGPWTDAAGDGVVRLRERWPLE